MNEFTAKKLGEVLAFAVVGKEIFERGSIALGTVLTTAGVSKNTDSAQMHADAVKALAEEKGVSEITLPKSEKTGAKLREMLDLYVGDQWDNPAELLEWLGFFEGAAVVHWKLVEGAAEALSDSALQELAATGVAFHQDLLTKVSTSIKELGNTKASA
jgi:hypothetical protein